MSAALAPTPVAARHEPTTRVRISRAALAAVLAALTVGVLRSTGVLSGIVAVVVTLAILLMVPTAKSLSARVLFTGALALGVVPLLWWVPLPVGPGGRATWLLALVAGAVAGWWAAATSPRARARHLLPTATTVDAIPWAAGLVAAWIHLPWLRARDGVSALAMMITGWDNSAHFGMIAMLRSHGATIDTLGSAVGGESWKFADYPQGYHSVVATVMELLAPRAAGSASSELMLMAQATGGVAVIGVVLLAAGICALPGLQTRPLAALPTTALVVAAVLLGPGGNVLASGFGNFLFACVLASCVPLAAMHLDKVADPLRIAVLGALLVGVAHSWVLLLSLALPAAVLAIVPLRRELWRATKTWWVLVGAIVLITALAGLRAQQILSSLQATSVLTTEGGIEHPDLGMTATVTALALGLSLWSLAIHRVRGELAPMTLRAATLGAVVALAGLSTAGAIGFVQLHQASGVSYYFWKYVTGLEIVSFTLVAVGISAIAGRIVGETARPPLVGAAASVVLAVASTQVFGFTGLMLASSPLGATSPGIIQRGALSAAAAAPSIATAEIVAAADAALPGGSHGVYLTPSDDGSVHPVSAQQWYLALRAEWTVESNDRASVLMPQAPSDGTTVDDDTARTLRVLDADPLAVVLVSPERHDVITRQLPDRSVLARVSSW